MDLSKLKGKKVKRWTYEVTNYPKQTEGVRANLLVLDGKVVGGDICSNDAANGFMHGFALDTATANGIEVTYDVTSDGTIAVSYTHLMLLNILMSVLSAALEFLFLAVFNWGIWAAALATCTGMFICAFIAFIPFFRGKTLLRFCRPHFHLGMIKQIVACGSPNFLNNIAGRITSIIMNFILVRMGGEIAVSVYGILMYVEGFIQPLLYGMCDSLQPAVGFN